MNNYTVYIHRNKINNKAYIGQTCQVPSYRWNSGKGYRNQSCFYSAINKYGWDNFEHIIWADGLTAEQANRYEELLIALFCTRDPKYGYNMSPGGNAWSEEAKQKLRAAAKNRDASWKQKQSMAHKGKKYPEAQLHSRKKVYCVELNEIFESARKASEELGIGQGNISGCCTGKWRKAGGYHFEYI